MWNAPACLKPPIPTTCPEELYKCFCRAGFAACFFLYPIAHQNVWFSIAFCHAWPEHRAPFKTWQTFAFRAAPTCCFSHEKHRSVKAPRWLKDLRLASLLLFFFQTGQGLGLLRFAPWTRFTRYSPEVSNLLLAMRKKVTMRRANSPFFI